MSLLIQVSRRDGGAARRKGAALHLRGEAPLTAILVLCAVCRVGRAAPLLLTPSLSVSEQYNDNVFFDHQRIGDFITAIHAGVSLAYQRPRLMLTLSTGNSSQLYAHQTQENTATGGQYGTLTASSQVSERLLLNLSDTMSRVDRSRTGPAPGSSPAPPTAEQPSPDAQASTLASRGSALTNSVTSGASYRLAPRWSGGVTYRNSLSNFSDPGGSDISNIAGLSLGYDWSPTTSISAGYSYAQFDPAGFPQTQSHNPTLGFSQQFDPIWSLVATGGVYVNSGSDVSSHAGPTFNVAATRRGEHASLVAGAAQAITNSGGVAGTSTTVSAFLGYQAQLLEQLSGSLYSTYGHFDTDQTTYQFVSMTAALSMVFWRYFTGGLSYSYRWQDNSQSTGTTAAGVVDGNVVQLYVSAAYPVWRGDL
jgi:hypothetical protein